MLFYKMQSNFLAGLPRVSHDIDEVELKKKYFCLDWLLGKNCVFAMTCLFFH